MTSAQLLVHLKNNPFVLAPMAGITEQPFRVVMRELGVGIVISELVSANGIRYGGEKTLKLMAFSEQERPVGIQIFGDDLDNLAFAAKAVEQSGADFIDLNFGCPVKKVVQKGAGSAILKDLQQLRKVLRTVKSATIIPVTIKIRTGWEQSQRNADEVTQIAFDEGITWVAIHGRTRSQGYAGQADWDYIASVKAKSPIPILGNGDILNAEGAMERLMASGCDGVMIGRGCLKNPWIFQQSLNLFGINKECSLNHHGDVLLRLYEEFLRVRDERMVMIQLRKFAMWYSAGYPGSSLFRKEIFSTHSAEETLKKALEYYRNLDHVSRLDTSGEAFLMGGHG